MNGVHQIATSIPRHADQRGQGHRARGFLRHATNRFYEAKAAIEADKVAGRMPTRALIEADFTRRRALMLPETARYDVLLKRA
jgi:hypothetical protein